VEEEKETNPESTRNEIIFYFILHRSLKLLF